MSRIKLLKKEIADKIAAGEVIEQPLSVVKELLENSLDAGATQIVVEIGAGGKDYIRVTDNGCGIEKEDLRLAFLPHATSKIETEEDLGCIGSLGFRGEALASVAAVSRLEIISKTADVKVGTKLTLEASEVISEESTAAETGTTIIVRDLFFNLPARRKFLKSDSSEAALITEFMSKIALAYPSVRIRMINNGTILFSTPGKGNIYQTILTVYSPQNAKKLLPLNFSRDGYSVKGYVSSPLESRTNRRHQVFFVNGRLIKSALLDNAVSTAYSDKLFEGRYPSVYMFLELNPSSVDVNIHPRKAEIKFFKEQEVFDFVVQAIRLALLNPDAGNITKEDVKTASTKKADSKAASSPTAENISRPAPSSGTKTIFGFMTPTNIVELSKAPEIKKAEEHSSLEIKKVDVIELQSTNQYAADLFKNLRKEEDKKELHVQEELKLYDAPKKKLQFSQLRPISQLFVTYILAESDKEFYIIDQHAAHERIMFEQFLSSFQSAERSACQLLLTPIVIDLDPSQMLAASESVSMLCDMGFAIEEFGASSFVIKEIPMFLTVTEAEEFVQSFFETADELKGKLQAKRDVIISKSCKAAVKAHDQLSFEEMIGLFEALDRCENPFSCPHGRPTFIKFSEYELERMFRRK